MTPLISVPATDTHGARPRSSHDGATCRVPRSSPRASRGSWRARVAGWLADDAGAATAEYAIVIMAAVSFAGLLVVIMRSGAVQATLTDLIQKALTVG
jgi:hypothetical protein